MSYFYHEVNITETCERAAFEALCYHAATIKIEYVRGTTKAKYKIPERSFDLDYKTRCFSTDVIIERYSGEQISTVIQYHIVVSYPKSQATLSKEVSDD